jgi:hypothetical protein
MKELKKQMLKDMEKAEKYKEYIFSPLTFKS